jgi:hypothetical protein
MGIKSDAIASRFVVIFLLLGSSPQNLLIGADIFSVSLALVLLFILLSINYGLSTIVHFAC